MRYYLDVEYHDNQIISIAVVGQDGSEYYAESSECNYTDLSSWVNDHVITQLTGPQKTLNEISIDLENFCINPEFWAYMDTSDFHFLMSLYGGVVRRPVEWPPYCFDLFQLKHHLGNPDIPQQQSRNHHALNDARWNREVWEFLENYARNFTEEIP